MKRKWSEAKRKNETKRKSETKRKKRSKAKRKREAKKHCKNKREKKFEAKWRDNSLYLDFLRSETKRTEKYGSKQSKKKYRSETKRKAKYGGEKRSEKKNTEVKESEKKYRSEKKNTEAKRSEKKKLGSKKKRKIWFKIFALKWKQNKSRLAFFALKRKKIWSESGAPYIWDTKDFIAAMSLGPMML